MTQKAKTKVDDVKAKTKDDDVKANAKADDVKAKSMVDYDKKCTLTRMKYLWYQGINSRFPGVDSYAALSVEVPDCFSVQVSNERFNSSFHPRCEQRLWGQQQ